MEPVSYTHLDVYKRQTFGSPVIFGNHYKKNPEADELIAKNGAKAFADEFSAADFIVELSKNESQLKEMSENAGNFVISQPNSSEIIFNKIIFE